MEKKMKLILISALLLVTFSSIGYAIWQIVGTVSFNAEIVSYDAEIISMSAISDALLNTSNTSIVQNFTTTITNTNEMIEMMFQSAVVIVDDTSDTCDNAGDCSVSFFYEGIGISGNDNLSISSGMSDITAMLSCAKFSCKQNVSSIMNLTAI